MLNFYKNALLHPKSSGLETISTEAVLSDDAIKDKLETVRKQIDEHQRIDPAKKSITRELDQLILTKGKKALTSLKENDEGSFVNDIKMAGALEVIVKMDGSRPTYLIKDGEVDISSNQTAHFWNETLYVSANLLKRTLPNVGRINVDTDQYPFAGTGFLIHQNLLVTNRHVLQLFGHRDLTQKKWLIDPSASVDFACEFKGTKKGAVRTLKQVVFAGPDVVKSAIDHQINDIAIIELDPVATEVERPFKLQKNFPGNTGELYTIGYPAMPNLGDYKLSLLEQLFVGEFGYKRLAPGKLITTAVPLPKWSFQHDATTLGGNSGSVVLFVDREDIAAGLHYGGTVIEPRSNYAHHLSKLNQKDAFSKQTIAECLSLFDIEF